MGLKKYNLITSFLNLIYRWNSNSSTRMFSLKFRLAKKSTLKGTFEQQGQALVEYILILVVTLTLVIGVATKLIPQLSDFMQNYAGAYVECLLETGDLPYFITNNPNSECSIENMRASGRLPQSSNVAGGGSGSGSNRGSQNSTPPPSSNSNSGGSSGTSSTPQPRVGANTGADSASTGSGQGGSGGTGDRFQAPNTDAQNRANNSSGAGVPYAIQEDNGRGITGVVKIKNPNASENDDKPKPSLKTNKNEGGNELRKTAFSAPINKKETKDLSSEANLDLGFQFGKYLRYLMIGGIILAVIIMVGTQINSLRKSWGSGN
jgi:hypothetical protein